MLSNICQLEQLYLNFVVPADFPAKDYQKNRFIHLVADLRGLSVNDELPDLAALQDFNGTSFNAIVYNLPARVEEDEHRELLEKLEPQNIRFVINEDKKKFKASQMLIEKLKKA